MGVKQDKQYGENELQAVGINKHGLGVASLAVDCQQSWMKIHGVQGPDKGSLWLKQDVWTTSLGWGCGRPGSGL